jgi:hypothetical protein
LVGDGRTVRQVAKEDRGGVGDWGRRKQNDGSEGGGYAADHVLLSFQPIQTEYSIPELSFLELYTRPIAMEHFFGDFFCPEPRECLTQAPVPLALGSKNL